MDVCSVFLFTDILQIFTLESLYLDDDVTTFAYIYSIFFSNASF